MKTVYFLFGEEASEMLADEGIDTFIEDLEDGTDISFTLYAFTPETNPAEFLHSFKGWGDYCALSFEEYVRISQYLRN